MKSNKIHFPLFILITVLLFNCKKIKERSDLSGVYVGQSKSTRTGCNPSSLNGSGVEERYIIVDKFGENEYTIDWVTDCNGTCLIIPKSGELDKTIECNQSGITFKRRFKFSINKKGEMIFHLEHWNSGGCDLIEVDGTMIKQ